MAIFIDSGNIAEIKKYLEMGIVRRSPPLGKSVLILLLFVFLCFLTLLVTVDQMCSTSIEQWIPYYPDAEVISVEYSLFRPRSMGETVTVLLTRDDEETVREFYRQTILALLDEQQTRGLARTHWDTEQNLDGDGTFIILSSECGTQ